MYKSSEAVWIDSKYILHSLNNSGGIGVRLRGVSLDSELLTTRQTLLMVMMELIFVMS